MDVVVNTVPSKVTTETNDKLIGLFKETKVKETLFQMFPRKAPGLDGFRAHFSGILGFMWGRGDRSCYAGVEG